MKKILFVIIGLLCLFSCTSNNSYTKHKNSMPEPKEIDYGEEDRPGQFQYIKIDGHIYLFYYSAYRSAMAHSGTCPCNNSNKIEEK